MYTFVCVCVQVEDVDDNNLLLVLLPNDIEESLLYYTSVRFFNTRFCTALLRFGNVHTNNMNNPPQLSNLINYFPVSGESKQKKNPQKSGTLTTTKVPLF